jgi:kynurenine formamidase
MACRWRIYALLSFVCLGLSAFLVIQNGNHGDQSVRADAKETPIGAKWWPSRWGANDERGAINFITAEKTVAAARLITRGKIYSLGHVYEEGMPKPGFRMFQFRVKTGNPHGNVSFNNKLVGFDDFWVGEIGQMGTQMDGLGHCGVHLEDGNDYFYNGFKSQDFAKATGLEKIGVEKIGVFFTRGVLIDLVAYKKVDRLKVGEVVSAADLQGALKAQGVSIQRGDTVLLRTGHSKLWNVDNDAYTDGEPGIDLEAARWLIAQEIAHLGADNWGIEVDPPATDNGERIRVHQELIIKNGICLQENLDLEELAADRVYEFAYVSSPLRIRGATGSPGNPIAVR